VPSTLVVPSVRSVADCCIARISCAVPGGQPQRAFDRLGHRDRAQGAVVDELRTRAWRVMPANGCSRCSSSMRRISAKSHPRSAAAVVHRRARHIERLRLAQGRQLVRRIDHRFALASPMRPSAPAKSSYLQRLLPDLGVQCFQIGTGIAFVGRPCKDLGGARPATRRPLLPFSDGSI
jgi:hypothetical protein